MSVETLVDEGPIGPIQLLVALLGTLVITADGFVIQLMGYIAPSLSRTLGISHDMMGSIISAGLFGVFLGYLLLAPLSSRVGHRTMMIITVASFGILTLLTTLARDPYVIMGMRFLTGLGLGASNPSAVSIIADFCPRRRRSTFIVVGICGVSFGSMCAGLAAYFVVERFGWEAVLLVGGIFSLLIAFALLLFLPNSLEHVVRTKGGEDPAALALARRISPKTALPAGMRLVIEKAVTGALTQVFVGGRLAGTLAVWVGFAMNLLVFFFVQSWLSTLVVQAGHSQQEAVTATTVLLAGGTLSVFAFGPLMDRFQPFKVLGCFFIAGGLAMALLGSLLGASIPIVLAAAFVTGFLVSGVQKGMNAIAVYFYPTALRSAGLGWALGIGRIGAVAGPLIAPFFMHDQKASAALFYFAAVPMAIGAMAMFYMLMRYGNMRAANSVDTAAAASVSVLTT